jgi:restriction endonuclease S subunit
LIEIIGGGTPDTNKPEYWGGDIPRLSVVDFNKDERFVSKSEKKITELGLKNSSTKYLQKGDLIISARGTVGALAQLSIPMTFNQSCYGLRAKAEIIDAGYLFYVLKQEIQQFKANAYGSKFDSITIKTFDAIKIPLPPLDVQTQIIEEIEKLEKNKSQLLEEGMSMKDFENVIKETKQAILKKYL